MLFSTECENIILEDSVCKGVRLREKDGVRDVYAKQVVIATGRRGADCWKRSAPSTTLPTSPAPLTSASVLSAATRSWRRSTRSCMRQADRLPGPVAQQGAHLLPEPRRLRCAGELRQRSAVVNGHSFKEKKSNNTNLAILVSHNFTEPFNQPIAYAQKVGELTNMLGAGHILVQRYGDILDGKRTWANELARTNVRPTLKDAVAGDITAAMPYRAMVNIIEFIKMMDEVVPGFASPETLLYSLS